MKAVSTIAGSALMLKNLDSSGRSGDDSSRDSHQEVSKSEMSSDPVPGPRQSLNITVLLLLAENIFILLILPNLLLTK